MPGRPAQIPLGPLTPTPPRRKATFGRPTAGLPAPTDATRATESGLAVREDVSGTAESETVAPTNVAQSTDSGAGAVSRTVQTAETDTTVPTGDAQATIAGTTGDARRIAAVEPAATTTKDKPVLAPAPDTTAERVPIGAPPATDTTDDETNETNILATVDDVVERIETTIRERLATESEADPDKRLQVQVTYDDSQEDTSQARAEPSEAARTADPGTDPPPNAGQTAGSTAAPPAEDTAAAPTGDAQTTIAGTTEDAQRIAAVEPAAASAKDKLVLAPAPDTTIERVPIGAPPATDTTDDETNETDILAIVDDVVERIGTTIRERLATESVVDSDKQLQVQITYDDSQEDASQAGGEPSEAARTAGPGTDPLAGAGQTAGSTVTPPIDDTRTADSGAAVFSDAAAESTGSAGASPSAVTRTADSGAVETEAETEVEAKEYVETLADTAPPKIPVDKADHFVTQEQVLALVPEDTIESVSVDELAKDETLDPETPITVVRESEEMETAVPERLVAESGGDLDTQLHVLVKYDDTEDAAEQEVMKPGDGERSDAEQTLADSDRAEPENAERTVAQPDTVERITVREVLERILAEPEKPITLIRKVRHFEVMTLRDLLESEVDADTFLNVIKQPYRIESATLADLLQRKKTENPDTIFYLHTVLPTDEQGIWGIVQYGIIDNFARGVALERGDAIETYTVQIPRDADERLADQSSSFLGKLIDRKTEDSYVYNYRDNRMGRNPDRIYPGQEIVIINFEPDELMSIYQHFASG